MMSLGWLHHRGSKKGVEHRKPAGVSWSKYLVSPPRGEIKGEGEYEWSADMSQLFIGNKVAVGRHSQIYFGIYKQRDVAIKLIRQPEEDTSLAALLEDQFNIEVALLLRLHHPNIVQFVAACKKPPVFCIITEYLAGGTLRDYLHQQDPHSVPLDMVLKLGIDIARGMCYLHSQGILHRDLKSENLLLSEDLHVKVADFGISCLESECGCGSGRGFAGTYRWMAPEMIKDKHQTKKVDVYSYGIVLWEILTAMTPFQDMTPEQAGFAVSVKNARPPLPTACPIALSDLISRCWSSNPDRRPHFHEIVRILESYEDAFDQDPTFFSSYRPSYHHIFGRCIPRCMAIHHPAALNSLNFSTVLELENRKYCRS